MSNFSKINVLSHARAELRDRIGLIDAEVGVNHLPAGASVPFVHFYKQNKEICAILSGMGKAEIDGEEIALTAGDWIRISPEGKRRFFAADDSAMGFACIQVKAGALEDYTMTDAIV